MPAATLSPVPAGMTAISYRGIELTVPETFRYGPVFCYPPTVDSVVPETYERASCPPRLAGATGTSQQRITVVSMGPDDPSFLSAEIALATSPVTVAGVEARHGSGTIKGARTSVLVLPDPGVVISVGSPTAAGADAILDTVRLAPIDRLGCRQHVDSLVPTGNPVSTDLVPGTPVSAVVCT